MNLNVFFLCVLANWAKSLAFQLYPNFCLSENCYERGLEISKSLHLSANVCNTFYKFSCGGWISNTEKPSFEIFWNHWQEVARTINVRIRRILEDESFDFKGLRKARITYRACLNYKEDYSNELILFSRTMGGWPITTEAWNQTEYDWSVKVAEITRSLNIFPLIKLHVDVDFENASRHTLYLDPGDLIMPNYILQEAEIYLPQLIKYKEWIVNTAKEVYSGKDESKLNTVDVDDMIAFEIQLSRLMKNHNKRRTIKIDDLNKRTNINWLRAFKVLFDDSRVEVEQNDFVAVSLTYLEELILLLQQTGRKTIANYVMWHLTKELARDTSSNMRYLNFQINSAVLGVEEDYPTNHECVAKISEYFNFAIVAGYSKLFVNSHAIDEVKRMAANIKNEFIEMLRGSKWLSKEAKRRAVEKINQVKILVGFPDWLKNKTAIETFYKNVIPSNNHFLNVLQLKRLISKHNLQKLLLPASDRWPANLLDVNGYYNSFQNSIIISLGLLEKPFFDSGGVMSLNYGALGSLIGHELSHALDTFIVTSKKYGSVEKWLTNADVKSYSSKIRCFKKQYSNYNIDGQRTIMENVADNIGLELSFRAYRNEKVNDAIPFLRSHMNNHQLYFVGFAQMWCEVTGNSKEFLHEEHAPVHFRVQGVIANSVHFHRTFNCTTGKLPDKCYLW